MNPFVEHHQHSIQLSVLVLRSYAAQRDRSTDAAAGDDRRLSGQVPSGAVDHQGLLSLGLRGLSPLRRTPGRKRSACRLSNRPRACVERIGSSPSISAFGSSFGIAVILKSRENARIAASYPTASGGNRIEVYTRFVWQYYFYVRDQDWGRMFLRICPYFPFNARIYLNQHEWLARRLQEEGIFFRKAANV